MPSVGRILAYVACAVPAAIGVAFVARYGFATSDTPEAGYATAALYGVVAAFAFGGPAYALAAGNRGRSGAAWVIWGLAVLAILTNGTHTLGAIAQRSAGTEAKAQGAKSTAANDNRELKRLEDQLTALGKFTPADAVAVAATKKAAEAAERTRLAECGDGTDSKQRGKNCRAKEEDEKAANEKLAAATTNKALTDRAAKLEEDAKAIRDKLGRSPPPASVNALGEALGRILSMPADTAATLQQMLVAVLVELIIAAILAMPELLTRRQKSAPAPRQEGGTEPVAVAPASTAVAVIEPQKPGNVPEILASALQPAKGQRLEIADAFTAYAAECRARAVTVLPPEQFVGPLQRFCREVGIQTRRRGERVWLVDVQVSG